MSKLPSLQWYPGDWRKDAGIQSLDFFDRGVWHEILMFMHESAERGVLLLNGKPMSDDALARLLGLDKQILTKTLTTLLDTGVAHRRESDGALYNKRMVKDEAIRQERIKAGKKGGNPNLVKGEVNQTPKQTPTPSSSSSSSSSDLIFIDFDGKLPKNIDTPECRDALNLWLKKLHQLGKPKPPISVQQYLHNFACYPTDTMLNAFRTAEFHGWLGLRIESLEKKATSPPKRETNHDRNARILGLKQ